MSLRLQAVSDIATILTDTDDFGWSTTVTDPSELSAPVIGFSNDIAQVIDPQTGLVVSGRVATAVFSISTLESAGFTTLPQGIESQSSKPWRVDFDDVHGYSHTFKVSSSDPDRTAGVVVCFLEAYTP
jgi:hypothetical protein